MLGSFLRLKIAIVLAILGLLVLGTGIGQRTIWLPPATLTASAPAGIAPAPLTVVSPELLKTRDGQFSMTVKGEGNLQLAVARERDIIGWIGKAAYTEFGAANGDFTALTSESIKGEATVPDPSSSDMWVSVEKGAGELSYTWQAPGRGDWALLLFVDGTAAAPTDISVTVDNEAGTPWAVPLMVIGSALLALAALMFILAPRKSKEDAVVPGRRAAGRVPADPATGALEVAKILAAREKMNAAASAATISEANSQAKGSGSTVSAGAADAAAAEGPLSSETSAGSAVDADVSAKDGAATDMTSALPLSLQEPKVANDAAGAVTADTQALAEPALAEPKEEKTGGKDAGDDKDSGSNGEESGEDHGSDDPGNPSDSNDSGDSAQEATPTRPAGNAAGTDRGTKPKAGNAGKPKPSPKPKDGGKNMSVKARWGAALAAVLVAGSVSPALAADTTTSPDAPVSSAPASSAPASDQESAAGFPNLLDSQLQRIAASVASVVASGDNSKNAQELESRVSGMALEVRTANYKIRAQVEKQAPVEPVNATKMLAKVVSTTATWPRSAMLVTQGENNALPQLLTLVQADARSNYTLINATPLLPGQTFPKVDKEGTSAVELNSAEGLKMSPEAAIAALSDRLTNADSKFADTFTDSIYISSVLDLQKQVVENAQDADYVFSHKPNLDSVVSLRTADGGAMVVVGNTFGIDATSKDDATLTVGDDAAVFTGGKETTTGFTLTYAEPVVMYIPPATGGDQLTILSANRSLVGGSFKE